MSFLNFSQLNILLQACTLLVISCLLLRIIDGQEDWPIVIDPFPDSDSIGPEPFPTPAPTPDCTYACQERVDEAMALINQLQNQLQNTNFSLFNRIITLESSNNNNGYDPLLNKRVSDLEYQLPANVSMLLAKINTDIEALRIQMTNEIASLRQDLEYKINNIPTGGGGGDGTKAMEVYLNLTQRINNLENGKIQNLITDSNLWRQNFRIVNATFAKLKKSTKSNNVVLSG